MKCEPTVREYQTILSVWNREDFTLLLTFNRYASSKDSSPAIRNGEKKDCVRALDLSKTSALRACKHANLQEAAFSAVQPLFSVFIPPFGFFLCIAHNPIRSYTLLESKSVHIYFSFLVNRLFLVVATCKIFGIWSFMLCTLLLLIFCLHHPDGKNSPCDRVGLYHVQGSWSHRIVKTLMENSASSAVESQVPLTWSETYPLRLWKRLHDCYKQQTKSAV